MLAVNTMPDDRQMRALTGLAFRKALQAGFVHPFGYRPRDSFHPIDWRLWKDGRFNFLFLALGTIVSVTLIFGHVL